jgi:uncharacterized membrane protein YhaH (DUF805 family)
MKWFLKAFVQFADFNGRARRKEYWMFALFQLLFLIAAMLTDNAMEITFKPLSYGPFYRVTAIAFFIPSLAVTVRRLHDIGKSGWVYLFILIPIAGAISMLVLLVRDSQPSENAYGPNPKEIQPGETPGMITYN